MQAAGRQVVTICVSFYSSAEAKLFMLGLQYRTTKSRCTRAAARRCDQMLLPRLNRADLNPSRQGRPDVDQKPDLAQPTL